MATAGKTDLWNGAQLATRWMTSRDELPVPVCHVVFRESRAPHGRDTRSYTVQDHPAPLTEGAFDQWLLRHRLTGAERLGVSLLLIRETLNPDGVIAECVIERRRGAIDGPLCGEPARVEFVGPAQAVRMYGVESKNRLVDLPPARFLDRGAARPQSERSITESFSGEDAVLRARFGNNPTVLERRLPTLFEDMVGLSSIVHLEGTRGVFACGIGWHGPVAFTLVADFPRLDQTLALTPEDERAVEAAMAANDLVRHEIRFDAKGLGVVARRRKGHELFIVRPDGDGASITPLLPDFAGIGTPDQHRWMRYAEAHESRTILDAYRDGGSDELRVLTGDATNQVWLHHIDTDGIEVSRTPANDSAAAARLRGLHEPEPNDTPDGWDATPTQATERAQPPTMAANTLLAKITAFNTATALLRSARDDVMADRPDALSDLGNLAGILRTMPAPLAAAAARGLMRRGTDAPGTVRALEEIEHRMADELAETRVVLTPAWADTDDSPFDPALADALPEAAYHMHEAWRCRALRRPTAAVFHAMAVARLGLHAATPSAVGNGLRWAALMAAVDADTAIAPTVRDALQAVRRASHAPSLMPAEKYTDEEAENLIETVAGFIRSIVAAMPACLDRPA